MKSDSRKTKSRFKNRLKGKIAVLVIKLVGSLPLFLAQSFGIVLGRLSILFNTREVKIARRNLELCFPELNDDSRKSLLHTSFQHSGMLVCEIARIWCSDSAWAASHIKQVYGEELLEQALSQKKGIVIILPHLGNWEMLNAWLTPKMELIAMYSPAQLREVDEFMLKGRSRTGLKLAEASPKGIVKLITSLRSRENLIILPDQEPGRQNGIFAPFFGIEALTMTLISKLLHKSGAIPLLVYVQRKDVGQGFDIVIKNVSEAILDSDMYHSVSALNQAVEDAVREVPEQYMWGYKRFRHRPEGEQGLY